MKELDRGASKLIHWVTRPKFSIFEVSLVLCGLFLDLEPSDCIDRNSDRECMSVFERALLSLYVLSYA